MDGCSRQCYARGMVWAIRLAKMGLLAGAVLAFGWIALVVIAAAGLLFLLLLSEPDFVG